MTQRLPKVGETWRPIPGVSEYTFLVEHVTASHIYGLVFHESVKLGKTTGAPHGCSLETFLACYRPPAKEIWVNEYPPQGRQDKYAGHLSRADADRWASSGRLRCKRYVEALDDELE